MFGFGKSVLNAEALLHNLSVVVVDVWQDKNSLDVTKFSKVPFFGERLALGDGFDENLFREKLRFLSGCAIISLGKLGRGDLITNLLSSIKEEVKDLDIESTPKIIEVLEIKAKNYAAIWETGNPNKAGVNMEKEFSVEVFGRRPPPDDIDANYVLYKQLSNLQRKYIFKSAVAIRNSKE